MTIKSKPTVLLAIGILYFAANGLAQTADDFNPGITNVPFGLVVQPNGKILVRVGSQTGPRINLIRFNTDGALDAQFSLVLTGRCPDGCFFVESAALQPDGKILIGGEFDTVNGETRTNLARLNPDGSLDGEFRPTAYGDGVNVNDVSPILVQADGKLLVGELCAWCEGALVRFNADGTKDSEFHPSVELFGPQVMVPQPDGKIIIGGSFESVAGQPRTNIARLNRDGTVDLGFNPGTDEANPSIAVQADGKILITQLDGRLARFNPDGTLETGFNLGVDCCVNRIALQTDGKIILGGQFTRVVGQSRIGLARLNADGSLDGEFNPGLDGPLNPDGSTNVWVSSFALQADGKILVAGNFTTLGGQARTNIGRLNNTGPATQNLTCNGSTITWLRGGTSPEVWRTSFEASTNGTVWTSLGAGQRIPGGWQLTGLSLAAGTTIRARGFVAGGGYYGSDEGIVETTLLITSKMPTSILMADGAFGVRSNRFGFNITGLSGQVIVVEASTNLLQWVALQTNTLASEPLYFMDPNWWRATYQFYRIHVQEQ